MERLEQLTQQTVNKNSLSCPNATTCTGSKAPVKVTITGAAGNIGYALVFMIGQGYMFGPNQPVDLTLLELPNAEQKLQGVIMELDDCALPLVSSVRGTIDYKIGFDKADFCILVGARPRGPGMERQDLLSANAAIFKGQGEAINSYASRNVKVLVVGNPANTNCMIASTYAPSIPRENFSALTRLDQNRALHQISAKVKTDAKNVQNLIIWGNHSTTQFPDISFGYIENYPQKGFKTSLKGAVNDDTWFQNVFVDTVAKRGAEIIKARELSSAASAASAVCDHIRDWVNGTKDGEYVSMGVMSDGSYGVSKDLCFSFPVVCKQGKWEIVKGYTFDAFSKKQIEITTKELVEEREMALGGLKK